MRWLPRAQYDFRRTSKIVILRHENESEAAPENAGLVIGK